MCVYACAADYIGGVIDYPAKIARINQIIDALELLMLTNVSSGGWTEYSLDDGQTKIKSVFRDPSQIVGTINNLNYLRNQYISKATGGRVGKLVDSKNFIGGRR